MSVTVNAYPTTLFSILSDTVKQAIEISMAESTKVDYSAGVHISEDTLEEFCNKKLKTIIMDKDTLLKTLEEHGATNIIESCGDISCECDSFHLDFSKELNGPYMLNISYKKEDGLSELIADLSNEYSTNAQELSYERIKERLEIQNLKIEEEEVYDDNTIVLTVNLE